MRLAVASGAWGDDARRLAEVTFPAMRAYARRVGAAFVELPERAGLPPMLSKLGVRDVLREFDRLLWLDADALIRLTCPNFFDLVPAGHFGAVDEAAQCPPAGVALRFGHVADCCRCDGLPIPDLIGTGYLNCGVYVADQCHAPLFADPPYPDSHPWAEQSRVNARIAARGCPVYHLPECFNRFPYHGPVRHWERNSWVVHFAGPPSPEQRLADLAALARLWIAA